MLLLICRDGTLSSILVVENQSIVIGQVGEFLDDGGFDRVVNLWQWH